MPADVQPVAHTDPYNRVTNIAFPPTAVLLELIRQRPCQAEPMRSPHASIRPFFTTEGLNRAKALTNALNSPRFKDEAVIRLREFFALEHDVLHPRSPPVSSASRRWRHEEGPDDEWDRQVARAHKAMLDGKPNRALDALKKSPRQVPVSKEDLEKIQSLHPHPLVKTLDKSLIPTRAELAAVPVVTAKTACKVLDTIKHKSAAGHSGQTFEMLRSIFTSPGGMSVFVDLVNAIGHTEVPPDPRLTAAVLALQPKFDARNQPNGVRPTCTKEPLQTLAARCFIFALREKMAAAVHQGQYCMAADGTLLAVLDTMCKLGTDPRYVATMLDKSNAYNAHSRLQMLLAVRDIFPVLYPVFFKWYITPTPIYYKGVLVCHATNGGNQGCTIFAFGYAMFDQVVTREALFARLPSNKRPPGSVSFADDQTLVHSPANAAYDVAVTREVLSKYEASLNDLKMYTFNPTPLNDDASFTSMYSVFVGNPVGIRDATTKYLEDWYKDVCLVRSFGLVHHVDAWYIFAMSLYASIMSFARSNHLTPHELDKVNEWILIEVRFYLDVPDLPWRTMMVPLVNGGLGIRPIRNSTHAVRRKLLDRLPPPPPGFHSLEARLVSAYRRCDPNVKALPNDEVSENEPVADPVELDARGKPVPLPRCFFDKFSTFIMSAETILPRDTFLAAVHIHLKVIPPPLLEGAHTAIARDHCQSFIASFGIRNTAIPPDFRPVSFLPIAVKCQSFIVRAMSHLVAKCVGDVALGRQFDPAFIPPPRAVPPPPGPISPQHELPTATDHNPYNPRRLVRVDEWQPNPPPPPPPPPAEQPPAADAAAALPPPAVVVDAVVEQPPVAAAVAEPPMEQPNVGAAVEDAPAAAVPPDIQPPNPQRRRGQAALFFGIDFNDLGLEHRAKKSRHAPAHPPSVGEPVAPPAVPQPAAAAAIYAAPVDDAASVGEEHQTNENPSSSPASQIDDHNSATAAKRPLQGPAEDAQIDGEIHPNKHSRGPDSSDE